MGKVMRKALLGSWTRRGGEIVADDVEVEIERRLREDLTLVASTNDGWSQLYVADGEHDYWEVTFPQSSLHGGGPRRLSRVTKEFAKANMLSEFKGYFPANQRCCETEWNVRHRHRALSGS